MSAIDATCTGNSDLVRRVPAGLTNGDCERILSGLAEMAKGRTRAKIPERIVALQSPHEKAVTLLVGIPGVSYRTAQVILAEIGTDMSRFPTGSKWLRIALVESAHAAARSKNTYLGSHYHRIRGRRGPAKAAVAVGHSILVICWHLLSTGETYSDLGGDYFDKRRTSIAHQRRLVAQLEAMGNKVILEPAA